MRLTPFKKQNHLIVKHPNQITLDWAQRIVNQQAPDIQVKKIEIANLDIGTTTRIRLLVDHDGSPELPRNWFVKLPSLAWRARLITMLPRLLHTEVRFYNEIAPRVPLKKPLCLAAQSQLGVGSTLVLADVSEIPAIASHPKDALTVKQAGEVMQQLARFHAHFWQHPELHQQYRWLAGAVRQLEDALGVALAVPLMKRGLKLAAPLISKELHELALRYARKRRQIMAFLHDAPQTLVHHDCHPGNLFWQHNQAGFLDWQLVRIGEGVGDVAYFLATALLPEMRRQYQSQLLGVYCKTLQEYGVTNVDEAKLMQRYRAHCGYAFEAMLITLAVGGMMNLDDNRELIRRTAAAVEDLDTFSLLL